MEMKEKLIKFGTNVKDSAEKLTKNAFDGSKKMTEKIKIQNKIRHAEAQLNEIYIAIGKKYEELYGNKSDVEFVQYMADIADARAQIAAARAELGALESASVCENCGRYVMESQKFCPYCGTKQEKDDKVIIASEVKVSETTVPDDEA